MRKYSLGFLCVSLLGLKNVKSIHPCSDTKIKCLTLILRNPFKESKCQSKSCVCFLVSMGFRSLLKYLPASKYLLDFPFILSLCVLDSVKTPYSCRDFKLIYIFVYACGDLFKYSVYLGFLVSCVLASLFRVKSSCLCADNNWNWLICLKVINFLSHLDVDPHRHLSPFNTTKYLLGFLCAVPHAYKIHVRTSHPNTATLLYYPFRFNNCESPHSI